MQRLATNFYPSGYEHQTRNFFFHATADQIRLKSIGFSASTTRLVNVVRDVGNMVPTLYIANKLAIPLKTPEQPLGLMTSAELYTSKSVCCGARLHSAEQNLKSALLSQQC